MKISRNSRCGPGGAPAYWLAGCMLLLAPAAWAQIRPVLNHAEGSLALAPAGDTEWIDVRPRRPVHTGERLWTDRGARAELQVSGHSLRLAGRTQLAVASARPGANRFTLTHGSLIARIGPLGSGENFEIDTPNLALRATQPGLYRLDIDPKSKTTRVSVQEGVVRVWGRRGETMDLAAGRQASFSGHSLAAAAAQQALVIDDFDRWSQSREQGPLHAVAARAPGASLQLPRERASAGTSPAAAPRQAAQQPRHPSVARAKPQPREPLARREATPTAPAQPSARAERWQREQQDWLRYNHGLPPLPDAPAAVWGARRAG